MTGSHRKPCKGGSIFIGTDEARKVEIVRRNLRIAASGEHIKLELGYLMPEALRRGARDLLGTAEG